MTEPTQRVIEVRALAEVLTFLPEQARMMMADKLHGLGARLDPEKALPAEEVTALADALYFIAVPGRPLMANQLRVQGVLIHPELATLKLEREGPAKLGKHAPQRVVKKDAMTAGMEQLRAMNPALAARIDAASTDDEKAAVDEEFGLSEKFPEAVETLMKHTPKKPKKT